MRTRLLVSAVLSAALVASAFVLGVAPAQAGEGIGSGRALIHIDAPSATVTKTGKNSYRMVLPPGSTGQWMGERTDAKGLTRTRVGDLTAQKLATNWGKFRYTSQGVLSTLAWSTSDRPSTALVRLSQPKVTDEGVRFDFTSKFAIPSKLEDVSINLQRAPKKGQARDNESTFLISDQLNIGYTVDASNQFTTRIFNQSNNNTCWGSHTINYDGSNPTVYMSVATNTCDNIKYQNAKAATEYDSAYGLTALFTNKKNGTNSFGYNLTVTPPGQDPFPFNHTIKSWPS